MRKPDPRQSELPIASAGAPAEISEEERIAALQLSRSENIGPVTFRELIAHCGSALAALKALPELSRRGGRSVRIASRADAEAELARARKAGASLLVLTEPAYPRALAAIEAAPPILYIKGDRALLERPVVAVVGSRQCSAAGGKLARHFSIELARSGYVVASGLARGIDSIAHEASLPHGTIAVLAGGIDVVYPPENAALHAHIGEDGCLVSEMPMGFQPRGKDFPRRNRIISGLALGVLVIEAARRSGTLVTARYAAEQGREVFAVPGHPLDPRAEGTNKLLKSGATLVTEAEDLLSALAPMAAAARPAPARADEPAAAQPFPEMPSQEDCGRVLAVLGPAPVDVDSVARVTGLSIRSVQVALIELSLDGRIERHGNGLVSLTG